MELIDHLKNLGIVRPTADRANLPEGWRVPKVGPAFEGKPIAITVDGQPQIMYAGSWAASAADATRLENLYGQGVNLGTITAGGRDFDVLKAIDAGFFLPKRLKLLGSFFQQQDLLERSAAGLTGETLDRLKSGDLEGAANALMGIPRVAARMVRAQFSATTQRSLAASLADESPIIAGRKVSMDMIMRKGLSTANLTILNRKQMAEIVQEVTRDAAMKIVPEIAESWRSVDPKTYEFTIRPGIQTAQYVELQGVSSTGVLEVRSEPSQARVTIDGQARGSTPLTLRDVTPGDYQVVLERAGWKSTQTVRIEPGVTAQLVVPIR